MWMAESGGNRWTWQHGWRPGCVQNESLFDRNSLKSCSTSTCVCFCWSWFGSPLTSSMLPHRGSPMDKIIPICPQRPNFLCLFPFLLSLNTCTACFLLPMWYLYLANWQGQLICIFEHVCHCLPFKHILLAIWPAAIWENEFALNWAVMIYWIKPHSNVMGKEYFLI